MPKFKERIAVMRAHNSVCFYCKKSIDSLELLEIDHIIPESLAESELKNLLERLEKPDFEINSYFNWVPTHRGCNSSKSDHLMDEANLRYFLELARKKEPAARREEERFDREVLVKDTLARLRQQIEAGTLAKDTAITFLQGSEELPSSNADPWILSFSINLAGAKEPDGRFADPGEALMASDTDDLPPGHLSLDRALMRELESAFKTLNVLVVRSEAPVNNGETLSVRYAVWLLDLDRVPEKWPNRWKLMQIAPFSEVYAGEDAVSLAEKAAIQRRNAVLLDEESDAPLNYRYCPVCSSEQLKHWSQTTADEVIYYISCEECTWSESF